MVCVHRCVYTSLTNGTVLDTYDYVNTTLTMVLAYCAHVHIVLYVLYVFVCITSFKYTTFQPNPTLTHTLCTSVHRLCPRGKWRMSVPLNTSPPEVPFVLVGRPSCDFKTGHRNCATLCISRRSITGCSPYRTDQWDYVNFRSSGI